MKIKSTRKSKMSFKRKHRGKWYNGNGELIRNPKAYARAIMVDHIKECGAAGRVD